MQRRHDKMQLANYSRKGAKARSGFLCALAALRDMNLSRNPPAGGREQYPQSAVRSIQIGKITAKTGLFALMLGTVIFIQGCGVKYSFTGGSIPEGMKTVTVEFFENTAPIVYPTLSQSFTEALKDRIRNQSSLSQVNSDGDAIFEGRITGYSITPAAVEAGTDRAALNRLSITVTVKYTNTIKPEDSFEQPFTRFKDFSSATSSIQAQEESLIRDINEMLTEDIYNRAFANW